MRPPSCYSTSARSRRVRTDWCRRIALDHLSNLPARAVGAAEKDTYGGYRSTTLDVWSKVRPSFPLSLAELRPSDSFVLLTGGQGNKGQMWKITKK